MVKVGFNPESLADGRDLALQQAEAVDLSATSDFASVESLAQEAGLLGAEPWLTDGTPLFLMREALQESEEELHDRFIVLMGVHTALAAMSRMAYKHPPLTLEQMQSHIVTSVEFFNSFSHR
jgi:hypothetical protein